MRHREQTKITFRVEQDFADILKELADLNYQSVSAYIRENLEKIVQEELR